ncbi:MAG TPA: PLP-dependent aminotransferase family protein [Thermoplasmata archaeon]|nr:PLP-dependent aminotransferase family protein [Thermoplasmata archaeon]
MAPNLEPLFSARARLLKASDVRELLKYSQDPTVISFGGGLPSPEAFPVEDLRVIFEELLHEDNTPALQYGPTPGDPLLKNALATMLASRGIPAKADQIIVTHGAQQALELFGRVFLDPGDIAMVTQPTYLGIFTALSIYQPTYHGVPTDNEGILPDVLEENLQALAMDRIQPKFLYIVPTFHNPTGVTTSLRRRRALVDLAAEYEIPIIEDDPYYDVRFEGDPVPPIASLDKEGWVIYLGSFSKVLAPGFRVGFAHGPADLMGKMALAKQGVDLFTNGFGQRVAERYLSLGLMKKHLPRIRKLYRRKRDVMLATMKETWPDNAEWTRPLGGLFLWATVDPTIDTKALLPRAAQKGVIYVAGHGFYAGQPEVNHMRLNFSFPSDPNIRKGIGILGEALREEKGAPPLLVPMAK